MQKITVYGLPLNPMPLLNTLKGQSFCVSYGTRAKLGKQLDQAIELVGQDGILLVDNGAFSAFQAGVNTMTDESYLDGFADWANDIMDRCPQAVAVIPDVIGGTWQQNAQLIEETMCMFDDTDRVMPIWHMDEPIKFLTDMAERFGYIGIGSSGEYFKVGTAKWHARMTEALAAIDALVADSENSIVRPRIHLMRAQSMAHLYDVDSSDSVNVSMNHNRQLKKAGENVAAFAARIDNKIQASATVLPTAHQELHGKVGDEVHTVWQTAWAHEYFGFKVTPAPVLADVLEAAGYVLEDTVSAQWIETHEQAALLAA
jgi:hypothetical protein